MRECLRSSMYTFSVVTNSFGKSSLRLASHIHNIPYALNLRFGSEDGAKTQIEDGTRSRAPD